MTVVLDTLAKPGCGHKPVSLPRTKTIKVNGVEIAREVIARETQHHPADNAADAWLAAGRALAVRELLLQQARRLNLSAEPMEDGEGRRETDDEALVRAVVEREVSVPSPDTGNCRRIYDQQQHRFHSADIHEVRHILLPAGAPDVAGRKRAGVLASELIAELTEHPERFDDLAAMHSACPSAKSGGHLGQISGGQTVPEFEAALVGLPCGAVAPAPVETRYGLHIVRVERHIAGAQLPFEIVHERIAHWLAEKARREAIRQYIESLAAHADIEGIALVPQQGQGRQED